jgi:hypothetical protein
MVQPATHPRPGRCPRGQPGDRTRSLNCTSLWSPTGRGSKSVDRRDIINQTIDYAGTFQFDVNPTLNSNTSIGAQYYRRAGEFVFASGVDFATPGLRVINSTAERSSGENYSENVTIGVYAQQQFGWNDRLFVTAAVRADDNSAFGEEFDLVYYPKASVAWVISEEPFFTLPHISALRLRAAFGAAGKQPGNFDALRTYAPVAGPNDVSTVTPASVGNPALGPERSVELEAGFDAGFFDDRAGLDFTLYRQTTRDAILLRPSAPSTGFPGSRFINIGEIANRGWEAMLRATPVSMRTVKWDATFSLAQNESEVLFINEEEDRIVVSSAFGVEHRVGYPLGSWFNSRIVSADFNPDGSVIRASMLCDDGAGGTTACYSGTTPVAPLVFLGVGDPKYEGTFSSTFTLGERVRLYGLMDWKTGFKKWDHVTRVRCSLFNNCRENVAPTGVRGYRAGATCSLPDRCLIRWRVHPGLEVPSAARDLGELHCAHPVDSPHGRIPRDNQPCRTQYPLVEPVDRPGPRGSIPERRAWRVRPAGAEPPATAHVVRHLHPLQLLGGDDEHAYESDQPDGRSDSHGLQHCDPGTPGARGRCGNDGRRAWRL